VEHFKSPFDARDFAPARVVENQVFFENMLDRAREHRFFSHPFLSAADSRVGSREFVSFMLTSIYKLVSPFTSLLCSLGSRAPNLRSRFALMDNIYEEMGRGELREAHPSLYLAMLASVGVSEDAAESMPTPASIRRINAHLREVVENRPFAVGCAVLAAAELIIPACFPAFIALTQQAFSNVDMTFFDRHGPRDEGHSDDAAMLFAMTADQVDYAVVDAEVKLHLDYRSELFDEWMQLMNARALPAVRSERPRAISERPRSISERPRAISERPRSISVRPVHRPSAAPPAG